MILSARSGTWLAPRLVVIPLLLSAALYAEDRAQGPLRELATPVRVALMPGGRLLVSDYDARAIRVLSQLDLSVQRSFAIAGKPVAVAWGLGRIFVGNETLGRVEAYNLGGQLMATFGETGSILLPNAVAVDTESSLVMVLDAAAKVIKVFDLDGRFLLLLTQPGALENPSAMAFDPARQLVLISDFGAFSNSVFAKPKPFVRQFDLRGTEQIKFTGTFARPQGISVDDLGRLYVVDSYKSQVQVLDAASGVLLGVLGSLGSGPGELNLPLDVVYSAESGKLYVTDNRNHRITTFAPRETP